MDTFYMMRTKHLLLSAVVDSVIARKFLTGMSARLPDVLSLMSMVRRPCEIRHRVHKSRHYSIFRISDTICIGDYYRRAYKADSTDEKAEDR